MIISVSSWNHYIHTDSYNVSVLIGPYPQWSISVAGGGGYLVQKTLRGCAANMGSKISILVYEWSLKKNAKSGKWMGRFFKIWPNLSQNWLKFKKIWGKIGNFVQNLAQNWADWYMNGLLFLEKLVFVWVCFQIPWQHIPTKSKLEYPPGSVATSYIIIILQRFSRKCHA